MNPDSRAENTKRYIIVDTCVLEKSATKPQERSEKIQSYFEELSDRGFSLAISDITGFESLHGLSKDKLSDAIKTLDKFEQKEVTKLVLLYSALLCSLYDSSGNNTKDTGDLIIGSTAFLVGGLVLTTNLKHYPCPFFLQEEWRPITTENKDSTGKIWCTETTDLVLFRPNIEYISKKISAILPLSG